MSKPDLIDATSADWTKGFRVGLYNGEDFLGEMTKSQREAFMRGYSAGKEARIAESK